MEFRQFYPSPGRVEHDAEEIWRTQLAVARACLRKAGVRPEELAAVGVTNQRETTVIWDRKTGRPIAPAIVWQDRRTSEQCEALVTRGLEEVVQGKRCASTATSPRRRSRGSWTAVRARASAPKRGELAFGTVDTWLIWNLTGGKVHATDVSNASRTLLCDIHTCRWDDELLQIFNVPAAILPEIRRARATSA